LVGNECECEIVRVKRIHRSQEMNNYNWIIQYILGKRNIIADLVPRLTTREGEKEAEIEVIIVSDNKARDKIEPKATSKEVKLHRQIISCWFT
jgi:hypothetical protein